MSLTPDDLLERAHWDFFWAPPDAVIVDRPELLYISCARDVPHLNTVTRLRAGAERLPGLVDEVVRAHAGRRSRWSVLHGRSHEALQAQLARAGYAPVQEHDAFALSPESYKAVPAPGIVVKRVDSIERLRHSDDVRRQAFDEPNADADEATLQRTLEGCTGPEARGTRFVAYDAASGQPLSTGGLNSFPTLGFGLLWGGGTVAEARGRGAYSAIVASRLDHARRRGLHLVGLYARVDTSAPIVARQGFERHGRMVYWERGPRA